MPPPSEIAAPASASKLGRWLKKVEASASPAAATLEAAPQDPVRRCCEAVRASWQAADAAAAFGGMAAAEWTKLEQEKKALDNLMQMVSNRALGNGPV